MAVGRAVDDAAKWARQLAEIPETGSAHRVRRDGMSHHITLFSKDELASLQDPQQLLTQASTVCSLGAFLPLGVGTARHDGCLAYFVVVLWPAAQQLRARWGLVPVDMHITLAFQPNDPRGVRRGPAMLLPLPEVVPAAGLDWAVVCDTLAACLELPDPPYSDLLLAANRVLELAIASGSDKQLVELRCLRAMLLGRQGWHSEALDEAASAIAVASSESARARPHLISGLAACSLGLWEQAWDHLSGLEIQHLQASDAQRAGRAIALCQRQRAMKFADGVVTNTTK